MEPSSPRRVTPGMDLIGLLILVLVLGIVFWLLIYVIDQLPLPPPFGAVAKAIVALIIVLILLGQIGVLGGGEWVHRPLLR